MLAWNSDSPVRWVLSASFCMMQVLKPGPGWQLWKWQRYGDTSAVPRGEVTSVTPNCTSCQPGISQDTGLPEVPCACQPCGDLLGLLDTLGSTSHLCVGSFAEQSTSTGISGHPDPITAWMLHRIRLQLTAWTRRTTPQLVTVCHFSVLHSHSEAFTWRLDLPRNSKAALGKCLLFTEQKKGNFPLRFYINVTFFPLCNVCSWTRGLFPLEIKELQRQFK